VSEKLSPYEESFNVELSWD